LVDDDRYRPTLLVHHHSQYFDRQGLRSSSGHFGRLSFNAIFRVPKIASLPLTYVKRPALLFRPAQPGRLTYVRKASRFTSRLALPLPPHPLAKSLAPDFRRPRQSGTLCVLTTADHDLPGRFGEGCRYRSWPVAPENYADSPMDPIAR
jgi:hypothetical protein